MSVESSDIFSLESLEIMSIKLAVYQRDHRPLEGLCGQLQCAGYDVIERYTETAFIEAVDDLDIDVIIVDAADASTISVVKRIRASRDYGDLPVMLIADLQETSLTPLLLGFDADDVIILPRTQHDLKSRVRSLARLTSTTRELEIRQRMLCDFGASRPVKPGRSAAMERIRVLLFGNFGERQSLLIEALGETATFAYAPISGEAGQRLLNNASDIVLVASDTALEDVQLVCREARAKSEFSGLPVLLIDDTERLVSMSQFCVDEGVECVSGLEPAQVIGLRVKMLVRQYRLRLQLRGIMTETNPSLVVDHLTGLYSRGFLYHYLESTIPESRDNGSSLSVVTCAIAGLADVNSLLGYAIGDQLIAQFGRAMIKSCRALDLIGRIRGSSFGIILKGVTEAEAYLVGVRMAKLLHRIVDQSADRRFSQVQLAIGAAEMNINDNAESLAARALQQPISQSFRQAS